MNIDSFIRYIQVIRKYRRLLMEYGYSVNFKDNMLVLCDGFDVIVIAKTNETNYTPIELDEQIREKLRTKIIQHIKDLHEEGKRFINE